MKIEIDGLELLSAPASARDVRREVRRAQLLRLAMRGVTAAEAARSLGIPVEAARNVYRDPDFRAEVNRRVNGAFEGVDGDYQERRETLCDKMERVADKSFQVLEELLESTDTHPSLRVRIAQDFMDRNPTTQSGHTVRNLNIDADQLSNAARVASEMDRVIGRPELVKKAG